MTLFTIPGVREPRPRTTTRPPKPVWSEYKVLNQVKCHRCLDRATLGWNTGAPLGTIPTARYQRRCGTERLLLCAEDARELKAADAALELTEAREKENARYKRQERPRRVPKGH